MDYLLPYLGSCLLSSIIIICIGASETESETGSAKRVIKDGPVTLETILGLIFFSALVTPIGAVIIYIFELKEK